MVRIMNHLAMFKESPFLHQIRFPCSIQLNIGSVIYIYLPKIYVHAGA